MTHMFADSCETLTRSSPMSEDSILEILSRSADDQLAAIFGESYSRLTQYLKSSVEDRSKTICIFKRFLGLVWLPNTDSIVQLTSICSDLKLLYVANVSKMGELLEQDLLGSACDEYQSAINENCQILLCIRDGYNKLSPRKCTVSDIQSVVYDTTSVLSATFKHCNDHSHQYTNAPSVVNENINNLFKLCNELLFQYLDFIDNLHVEFVDIEQLNDILEATFSMGTLVSNLELKTMAQLWKSFTSILQKHADLRDFFDVHRAIRYFCTEIHLKIGAIYEVSGKNRMVALKVLNFLLKVVLKLCEYFSGHLNKCLPDLYQLVSVLYLRSYTRSCGIAAEIESTLLPAADSLVTILMKEDEFMEHFVGSRNSSDVSKLLLLSVILQKLILIPDTRWSVKLMDAVFENISSCSAELHFDIRIAIVPTASLQLPQNVYLYDALLVHLASLIICAISEQQFFHIERLLAAYLLRSSLAMKLFVCDLWCVIARYGSSELCFEHAELLVALLRQMHFHTMETVFIKSLLARLFKFLSRAQQQKFVDSVRDWGILVEICYPKMNCALSVCDDSFVDNISRRIRDSWSISNLDADLLLRIRVACKINETASKKPIQEYVLSVWNQLPAIQDCKLFLRCIEHLIVLSQSYRLPHSVILPAAERLLACESVFLKLLVLDYLKSLGSRRSDDLDADKFSRWVASLFGILLADGNSIIRERALVAFSYFSHVTAYERIIQITAEEPKVATSVANFVQCKVTPATCEMTCDDFLRNLMLHRQCVVSRDSHEVNLKKEQSPQPLVLDQDTILENEETDSDRQSKKIKLDFDFDGACMEIESKMKSMASNLNSYELSKAQKDQLKLLLETADALRIYL